MKRLSEDRFLADLFTKDAVQANFMQRIVDSINNVAKGAGVAVSGDLNPPPPVNAITVKTSGEQIHATLSHGAEVNRTINYFIEADTSPSFTQPHIMDLGASRSHVFNLPSFSDTGAVQQWYLRAYAQYPGSKPSVPTVLGGIVNPTPLTLQGATKMTLLPSTGSGTASSTGQQGGSGRGRQRVSTPKTVRIGKKQASAAPVVPPVTKPPVIIFRPQANGSTAPVVVVDQSGGNGIDFGGGTPISGRLTAGNIAFADLSGNLILKNIAQALGSTSGPTTNVSTMSTMPEMTVTVTIKGNPVLLAWSGMVSSNAVNGQTQLQFFRDGVALGNLMLMTSFAANFQTSFSFTFIDETPTAGSHTYTVGWAVDFSPHVSTAGQIARQFQVVELG